MPVNYKEISFEEAIEDHFLQHGFGKGSPGQFNRELALFPEELLAFLQNTQPKPWAKLCTVHGATVESKVFSRIDKEIKERGLLDVLRHGIDDHGVKLKLAFFLPPSGLNPDTLQLYAGNILTITRQLKYSLKNENSIDSVLSVNGLPLVTMELKNPLTAQTVKDAVKQYKYDRDPAEPLLKFNYRSLVHFAVDPNEVYMTTRLDKDNTYFLPFNKGRDKGPGNPDNPDGYRTAYLWEAVLTKDSLMDILHRFIQLEKKEEEVDGQTVTKKTLIFPRYHQLDAVRRLTRDAAESGVGRNYLIQHSAGSGKSNSIAWLAYHLASLHDKENTPVFHSIIVITDRRVLDKQLRDNIYQFEHKQGVVVPAEKHSAELSDALKKGARIIITTLQKFPFVLDVVGTLPKRRYAIIADEAHSSQTGESARKMKEVLAAKDLEEAAAIEATEEYDPEDEILKAIQPRGKQANLSFFAFTATPKQKTLEMFGVTGSDGKPHPFHLYSMRQAIKEGFILDVLEHYITYSLFYKVTKRIDEDPNVDKKKAAIAVARFVSLHPHNLAQKTEVIIEHFRQFVRHRIKGKAKAMVVTSSRLHAVRYKQAFDKYIAEKKYDDIKALVAFSGEVKDPDMPGASYTEAGMNGFPESQVPKKFKSDEYQLLLVAEKYQTGFDQPLLHTMYVDKRLTGLNAVQTLSRLNRTRPGKEDTFVLDFVNKAEDIREAFMPYYEGTEVTDVTDFNKLYDMKNETDAANIYWQDEVDGFCAIFFKPLLLQRKKDHAALYQFVNPAAARWKSLDADKREEFKGTLESFVRAYAFLSQIYDTADVSLEKLYAYGRLLLRVLRDDVTGRLNLDGDIALQYYRLKESGETYATPDHGTPLPGDSPAKGNVADDVKVPLSEVIHILNDKYGTNLTEKDRLIFEQIAISMAADEKLTQQARQNTLDNYRFGFESKWTDHLLSLRQSNDALFQRIMCDEGFGDTVKTRLMEDVYRRQQEI